MEHSALTGSNLHEPKGVSAATAGQIYIADGLGSGSWTTAGQTSLASAAKAFEAQLLHVQDRSGRALASGSWLTRTLATTLTNEITSASLAANRITLPAGTYYIEADATAGLVQAHQARFYNITDGSTAIAGTCEFTIQTDNTYTKSLIKGRFTIAGSKAFELQHRVQTTNSNTTAAGISSGYGEADVFANVLIWKVA